jgi:hypothetical protein
MPYEHHSDFIIKTNRGDVAKREILQCQVIEYEVHQNNDNEKRLQEKTSLLDI